MGEEESGPANSLPALRILITVAACTAFLALERIPLPGLRADMQPELGRVLNFATLGMRPIISAFILVELVAAIVPGFRPLRSSNEGRMRLRRTALGLTLLLALVQIFGFLRYARSVHFLAESSVLHPSVIDPRLAMSAALFFGVVTVMVLARVIDVAGVGVGYSLLIATEIGASLVGSIAGAVHHADEDRLLRLLLMLGAFAFVSWAMLRSPPRAGSRARYRLPTPGLEPVHQAAVWAGVALNTELARAFFWPMLPKAFDTSWATRGLQLLLTLTLCHVFSRLFHRPSTDEDKAALIRATRASTVWLAGLTMGSWLVETTLASVAPNAPKIDAFWLVTLIAVGLDLTRELRSEARTGRQRQLRVVHRLEDADALAAALSAAGIGSALRGAHHRALFQFFAPFIPIGVLVPEAQAERAEIVAVEHERALAEPPPMPKFLAGTPAPG